jgi:hypothetical protein
VATVGVVELGGIFENPSASHPRARMDSTSPPAPDHGCDGLLNTPALGPRTGSNMVTR